MPDGQVLEFSGVTKRFGAVAAVSDFSARIEPGLVTGFLGPNGAGKTTSLRVLLGLVAPTSGTATIGGRRYASLRHPLQTVGAVLEASSFHPGRTAANHLKIYARAAGIPVARVDETLAIVGLSEVAGRKVGGFSLGMRQRLGLAFALLGDPGVLVLDEPANGLDPEGIRWMRGLLRQLARQGRTVLVSSHLLAEVQQTADALLIISQGHQVFHGRFDELTDASEYATVVDAVDRAALTTALDAAHVDYDVMRSGLTVRGLGTGEVGALAAAAGVALSSLQRKGPGLEDVFLELVSGARVHASAGGVTPAAESDAAAEPPTAPADAETAAAESVDAETVDGETADGETAAAESVGAETVDGEEPAAAGAAFAVASTGVIDVITSADEASEAAAAEADPAQPAEASGEASFAVATTGVIDVVPHVAAAEAEAEGSADELPQEPAEAEPDADGEPVAAEAEPERAVWTWPADDDAVAPDAAPAAEESAEVDEDGRTEADREADRFFAAFDPHDDDAAESAEESAPESPESPDGDDADGDDASDTADEWPPSDTDDAPEGGDQR